MLRKIKKAFYNYNKKLLQAVADQNYDEIVDCLEHGADPNSKDKFGLTPIMIASAAGHIIIVKLLLMYGADPNAQNNCGTTALMFASVTIEAAIVVVLLKAGADPNVENSYGSTALMVATKSNCLETVELLLQAGANPNVQNNELSTALMLASHLGHLEITELLLQNGAGAMINVENKNGKNALIFAAMGGPLALMQIALHKNDYKKRSTYDINLLSLSIKGEDHLAIVKLLLKAGADINAKDSRHNKTAFMLAMGYRNLEIAHFLLQSGAEYSFSATTFLLASSSPKFKITLEHETDKNNYISELRKNARILNQGHRDKTKIKYRELTSILKNRFSNDFPEAIKNNIFLSLPPDLLQLISIFACMSQTNFFDSKQIQGMANRFFNRPPKHANDIKEEQKYLSCIKQGLNFG